MFLSDLDSEAVYSFCAYIVFFCFVLFYCLVKFREVERPLTAHAVSFGGEVIVLFCHPVGRCGTFIIFQMMQALCS